MAANANHPEAIRKLQSRQAVSPSSPGRMASSMTAGRVLAQDNRAEMLLPGDRPRSPQHVWSVTLLAAKLGAVLQQDHRKQDVCEGHSDMP